MNKLIFNRLALLGLVACASLPVFAQTKTPATKMGNTKMSGSKMSGGKMMSGKMDNTKMSGSKMSGSKMSGSKMGGKKMHSSMSMGANRLAWYKKTYGAQWKHHYSAKV